MEFNEISYGNPTIDDKAILSKNGLVDDLFLQLKSEQFPLNDSELTKDELNEIVDCLSSMEASENSIFLKRYKAYDRNLAQMLISTFKQQNIEVEQLVKEIIFDISSLTYKLKYFYQRPRPIQLARYYKLKLFPYSSYSADTPSFPSGQSIESIVILNVIGSKYPELYKFCNNLSKDISDSRVYLGLNYPSDIDFSRVVAKQILKHKNFTKKYGI